ncbi:MAG TPA: cyclic lactone autoinducer peptide [Symbiobacteriaceae bacterium]|nr:cyclic lactone autoinducer peptide [Symbiobacteriaceae bacterium]
MAKRLVLALVAGALTSLAFAGVAGACWWGFYQPKTPKALSR